MNKNLFERVAFASAAMVCLSEKTEIELSRLTEILGVDTLDEALDNQALQDVFTAEDMGMEIYYYTGMDSCLHHIARSDEEYMTAGNSVARLVADLHPAPGEEVCALFAVLTSRTATEMVSPDGALCGASHTLIFEHYVMEEAQRHQEQKCGAENVNLHQGGKEGEENVQQQ